MRLLKDTNIDFIGKSRLAVGLSLVAISVSLIAVFMRGLNFGVDFTGGTVVEVGYPQAVELGAIRDRLHAAGFEDSEVQYFGTAKDVIIRLMPIETAARSELSNALLNELRRDDPEVELRRVEFVGPKVGEELRESGGLALLYALFGILIYVAFRFEYRFAFGAVIALVHDVVLTVGFFSLTAIDFDLSVLAAILAVIGYSLNDTIVVYDRIRESFVRPKRHNAEDIINAAINRTLARTLVTSLTTLLVLSVLLILGGEGIAPFSIAMIVGVLVGTYSSVYIAGYSLLVFGLTKEDMQPVKKEGEEFGGA